MLASRTPSAALRRPAARAQPAACTRPLRQWRRPAIEEKREQADTEASVAPDREADIAMSDEQLKKLAALRKEAMDSGGGATNILSGAVEEAQLITWPKPAKALLDTVLVLGIVAGVGLILFGFNVAMADLSQWFYSQGK